MKTDRGRRVAVCVQECTLEQKKFVWDYLHGGRYIDHLKDVSWISNKGYMSSMSEGKRFYEEEGCPTLRYYTFINNINPYGEKKVQVQCSNDEEYLRAQEFAFDLGYTWYSKHGAESNSDNILGLGLYHSMRLSHSDEHMSSKYDHVISFDQFMALELPSCQTTPLPVDHPGAALTEVPETEKLDAHLHMSPRGYIITDRMGNTHSPLDAYKYNLLSIDEFKEKYEAFRFNGIMIREDDNPNWLRIGPITLSKEKIRGYMSVCAALCELPEGYEFFQKHAKELGL